MGRRRALLVATYEYEDAGLRRLTTPAQDAQALADVLEDPAIAGFEVQVLINEPTSRVGEAIGEFYASAERDDLTLLYFSGRSEGRQRPAVPGDEEHQTRAVAVQRPAGAHDR
ncbi:caspase family protein [Kribbella rubisoli]|uniref:caspase family protein n=1 Tax=Kribbella rubisoli TaxID=3075929 RepID=UPI00102AFCC7|nr:caspase family protein [Kribbella rubisoli]